jgi:hypothetical protein
MSDIEKQNSEGGGEDDPEDSQNKSVSLDDSQLGKINKDLKVNMNSKIKGMNSIIQDAIHNAIQNAEVTSNQEVSGDRDPAEEYESLVF